MNRLKGIFRRYGMASPVYFSYYSKDRHSSIHRIHRFSSKHFMWRRPIIGKAAKLVLLMIWPFSSFFLSLSLVTRYWKSIYKKYNLGYLRLLTEQLFLTNIRGIPPRAYYRYKFYLKENRIKCTEYIFNNEVSSLLSNLPLKNADSVNRKDLFYRICFENNIPIPKNFNILSHEKEPFDIPMQDIVLKPHIGSRSIGVEVWEYKDKKNYQNEMGMVLNRCQLENHIREKVKNSAVIIQKRLKNHKKLIPFSNGKLITVRVVTVKKDDNTIIPLLSVLIMPFGLKNQMRAILSPIDSRSGKLGEGVKYGLKDEVFISHPNTNQSFVGVTVPYWQEVLAMVIRAHIFFKEYLSLGWDVAITDTGCTILEANKIWDIETVQKPHNKPLGRTIFKEICLKYIEENQ